MNTSSKIRIILMLVMCFFSLEGKSILQEIRVTLQYEKAVLSEVLNAIADQTGLRFSYSPQQIDAEKLISVNIQNKNLEEVLEQPPFSVSHRQMGRYIILFPIEGEALAATEPKLPKENKAPIIIDKINEDDNKLKYNRISNKLKKVDIPHTGVLVDDCHNCVNIKNEQVMKKNTAAILLLAATMSSQASAQKTEQIQPSNTVEEVTASKNAEARPFQFSFIYPLGTDWIYSQENTYNTSLNLIGGITGRINGIELASVFNINKYCAHGIQLAGVFNMAGLDFTSNEESNVLQATAAFNFAKNGSAVQFSGGFNAADTGSFQAAAGVNIANASLFQAAAGINLTRTGIFQSAGGLNIAETAVCQIAGGANVAKETSCQIACVNITKKGGFQLGIVNVRDTADGVPVGLVNIVRRGGMLDLGVEAAELVHTALTFRSGINQLYTIFSLGFNFTDEFWAGGFGIGTSFRFTNWLSLNLELMHYNLNELDFGFDSYIGLSQLRPMIDFRIARHLKIYAGPTFNLLAQTKFNSNDDFADIGPKGFYSREINNTLLNAWIGITGGIRF